MRPPPSWRFWLLAAAGGLAQASLAIALLLATRVWVAPVYLLGVVAVPLGLARERSLQAMPQRRRGGWALVGGVIALGISASLVLLAFLVALTIACENGC